MTLYYNKTEGDTFCKLGLNEKDDAYVEFSEAVLKEHDDYFELFCYVTKAKGVVKTNKNNDGKFSQDHNFVFTPQVCRITVSRKEHTREYNNSKTIKKPTENELVICEKLEGFKDGRYFKGRINFNASADIVANYLIVQVERPDKAQLYLDLLLELEEIKEDEVKYLKDLDLSSNYKKKGGGGKYTQSELDRLIDRATFVKAFMMDCLDSPETAKEVEWEDVKTLWQSRLAGGEDMHLFLEAVLRMVLGNE